MLRHFETSNVVITSKRKGSKMTVYTEKTNEELLHSIDVLVKDKNIMERGGYYHIAEQDQMVIDLIIEELKSRKEN